MEKTRKPRSPRKITETYLHNAALFHLGRFATSAENLRRVLMRKVLRSARHHECDPKDGEALVTALIARFQKSGLLDDKAYSEGMVTKYHRRGASARMIRGRLAQKGVTSEHTEAALAQLFEETSDPEFEAAALFARRRRIGPYRDQSMRASLREKDLASLARAGFSYDIANRVIDAETFETLEQGAGIR
jgi:regulatory protein